MSGHFQIFNDQTERDEIRNGLGRDRVILNNARARMIRVNISMIDTSFLKHIDYGREIK